MIEKIIGRQKEIEQIQKCMDANQAQLIIVYGRRRVGKTFLINNFFNGRFDFKVAGSYAQTKEVQFRNFITELKAIVSVCRQKAYSIIDTAQVVMNWNIGKRIVEQEQCGQAKAQYGKYVVKLASKELTAEYGNGFSESNIRSFRKFYIEFSSLPIQQTVSAESISQIEQTPSAKLPHLSWSHYERLMRVTNKEARLWYMNEAESQMWSVRTLNRNISTQYYERLLLSQTKDEVQTEMKNKIAKYQTDKLEYIKNPTVLEFLGLQPNSGYTEQKLEKAIIDNIQKFLMEMGKGFAFVNRQELIRTEIRDYYIDLVFYNYILKCFFLVDLKIGCITHQDVGQMDMYIRMYDELKRTEGDNPTIGIVLCAETDPAIAKYSILKGNEQLFASKYELILPKAAELQAEINRQAELVKMQLEIGDEE